MAEPLSPQDPSTTADDPHISVEEGDLVDDEEMQLDSFDAASSAPRGASFRSFGSGAPRAPRSSLLSFEEGDRIADRYLVERVLGRDGYEIALYVRHLELGERALMRCLLPAASDIPDAISRFRRGARHAMQHRSEHTERVLDFGRLPDGSAYKVVELPRGPSLEEIVRVRGVLPIEEAVDTAITICEALTEVHASRNVFRNLSPANVYVERRPDGTPTARLVSSGGLEMLEDGSLRGDELAIFGTAGNVAALAYAAPEQFRNPAAVDSRADVWSVGALLYELLTGSRPFPGESAVALIAMIAADSVASPSAFRDDLDDELDDIVLRCLEKDPAHRPQTMHELVELLVPFATEQVQATADRVRRIALRSTRPPSMPVSRQSWHSVSPSAAPRSVPPLPRSSLRPRSAPVSMRSSSNHVGATLNAPPHASRKSFGVVILGAGVGAIAALAAMVLNRPPAEMPKPAAAPTMNVPLQAAPPRASAVTAEASVDSIAEKAAPERRTAARPAKAIRPEPRSDAVVPALSPAAANAMEVGGAAAPAAAKTERKAAAALFGGID